MDLSNNEFNTLSDLIYRKIGIRFELKKIYFVSKRVEKRIEALSLETPMEYIRYLRFSDRDGMEFQALINLLTVNETYFFRDYPQIQSFAEHSLPEVIERKIAQGDNTLRIWSAGCSTGEEPYTLAIILQEMFEDLSEWKVEILASDIDERVLALSKAGIYDKRSVKEMPEVYLRKYFRPGKPGTYHLSSKIKSMVSFEHLNFFDRLDMRKRKCFDFVFCRNVLIYFDDSSRRQVVDHFYIALNKGGYIFLGSSESVGRITTAFKLKRSGDFLAYCKE